ncbi:DUF4255 domain-containing protein [candidate division KSB1 bacterium]|nr:DUF4255 domain-containing protein [candidate division KSB1 bacterium]RQW07355.1 MAG: DUF4255 domain-containing protein [candidate division KSB1 bacterium]
MLDLALKFLKGEVADYLSNIKTVESDPKVFVELTRISDLSGHIVFKDDSIGLTLINIEEERVAKSQMATIKGPDDKIQHLNPEIKLNLYILFTANYSDYETGLKYLSGVVRCFQRKNAFAPINSPALDPSIQKLIVDLYTLDLEQQHHLWGLLGAKFMSSVMYKVRLITIQERLASDEQPPILEINSTESSL